MLSNPDYGLDYDRVKHRVKRSQPLSLEMVGESSDRAITVSSGPKSLSQCAYKIVDASGQTIAQTYDLFWGILIMEILNHVRT